MWPRLHAYKGLSTAMPVTLGSWDEQGLTLERESVPSGFDTHLSLVPFADKIETWHGAQVNKQTNKQTKFNDLDPSQGKNLDEIAYFASTSPLNGPADPPVGELKN